MSLYGQFISMQNHEAWVRSGTVSGTETNEAASKLVFGLLPETEPGSGKGRRLDHMTSILF